MEKPAEILRQSDAVTDREPGSEHRGGGGDPGPQKHRRGPARRVLGEQVE